MPRHFAYWPGRRLPGRQAPLSLPREAEARPVQQCKVRSRESYFR